jgi:hypothetical protein
MKVPRACSQATFRFAPIERRPGRRIQRTLESAAGMMHGSLPSSTTMSSLSKSAALRK